MSFKARQPRPTIAPPTKPSPYQPLTQEQFEESLAEILRAFERAAERIVRESMPAMYRKPNR